ncbi:MAG: site-specific DNA-methyltransferase, partial [Armatimonadetes bacterium]|nr:site-specific DNA-methyltransferase [Armatimonadota bacterium]
MAEKAQGKTVETLTHTEDTRLNIPTAEYQSVMAADEAATLRVAYERRNRDLDPQLVWRGKDAQDEADLVAAAPPLYIQEKVHPRALVEDLMRRTREARPAPAQLDLFGDFDRMVEQADRTEFYRHEQGWTNRMILGDSLQVMASLAEREGLRGKVQCIYLDPPYGIKFNSNFQWSTTSRDVKDGKADHVTREPEQVRAFRDTWRDGVHTYLAYLRDRLTVARDLLTDSGSIFVQIGDENVHRVRCVMDEVFGDESFSAQITFRKKMMPLGSDVAEGVSDYILWYAKDRMHIKSRPLFYQKNVEAENVWSHAVLPDGRRLPLPLPPELREGASAYQSISLLPAQYRKNQDFPVTFEGRTWPPPKSNSWKTGRDGMDRCVKANRLHPSGSTLRYILRHEDYPVGRITNLWADASGAGQQIYVVQTNTDVVKRCLLMATDPGDLVLDPTCGSGTTATVAEQWGRRWITIDTSRVALALARARIMGARYPAYLLADTPEGLRKEAALSRRPVSEGPTHRRVRQGFVYDRVPHITLKSIANNAEIDVIWERRQPAVEQALAALNAALRGHRTPFAAASGGRAGKALRFDGPEGAMDDLPSGEKAPAAALLEWEVPRQAPADWPAAAAAPLAA